MPGFKLILIITAFNLNGGPISVHSNSIPFNNGDMCRQTALSMAGTKYPNPNDRNQTVIISTKCVNDLPLGIVE